MQILRENTATRITVGPFYDVTDGITPEIALTVTNCFLTFIVDDAGVPTLVLDTAPTASGGANDMVHITSDAGGYYDLELAAANVNYTGRATLSIHDTNVHLPVFHEFQIVSANVYDSLFADGDVLDVNTIQVGGTAQTAGDIAALVVTADTAIDVAVTDLANATDGLGALKALIDTVNTDLANGTDGLGALKTLIDASDVVVDAIKVVTDKFAFTVANQVDANTLQIEGSDATDQINAAVDAALDTAIAELGVAAPTATPTMRTGLMLLYMMARNKTVVQTSGTDALEVYNNSGTKITQKLLTDDGSDFTEAEMG